MSEVKVNKISPRSGTGVTLGDSGDNFTVPSGGTITIASGATLANNGTATGFASIAWQSTVVTGATHTASANQGIWINTTSNACTLTLPGSPSVGDQLIFSDFARTWGSNAVTLTLNGSKYQGQTSPVPIYDTTGETVHIVYSGSTQGWIPINDGAVADEVPQTRSIDYLVIGGGGGGGTEGSGYWSGGGGAGGYRNSYNSEASGGGGSSETGLTLNAGITLTATIGQGGAKGSGTSANGSVGNPTSLVGTGVSITSLGGGYGGGVNPGANGGSGGSGGGANDGTATSRSGGSGTANQGYNGGDASGNAAGGGGGAGGLGGTSTGAPAAGGVGLASSITGSAVTRGVGGAGGKNSSGTIDANTGKGGDGTTDESARPASAGSSGVVILRVATSQYSGTTTGSPTVTTDGTDKVITFTGTGTYVT